MKELSAKNLSLLAYIAKYRHLSQRFKHRYSSLWSEYKKANDQIRQSIRCSH